MAATSPTDYPQHLPQPRTPIIGREREPRHVGTLLCQDDIPLLTQTGPGGVGKTRIALQAAREMNDAFAEGVVLVALVSVRDSSLVLPTIARGMGVHETAWLSTPSRQPALTLGNRGR